MILSINIWDVASYYNKGIQLNDLKKINFNSGVNWRKKITIALIEKTNECLEAKE